MSKRSPEPSPLRDVVLMATRDDSPLHVTLFFRAKASTADIDEITQLTSTGKFMPDGISFSIGSHIWVGREQTLEAVAANPGNFQATELEALWKRFNRREGVETKWKFNPHITLKDDSKRAAVAEIEKQDKFARWFRANRLVLRTVGDEKTVLLNRKLCDKH